MMEHTAPPDHESSPLEGIPGRTIFEHSGALNMLVATDTTLLAVNNRFVGISAVSRCSIMRDTGRGKKYDPDVADTALIIFREEGFEI